MNNPIWRYVHQVFSIFWKRNKGSIITGVCLVSIVFLLCIASRWWEGIHTYAEISGSNKAKFHQGGWFFNDSWHDLSIYRGAWYTDEGELDVPVEGPYSERDVIRFDAHAKVYVVDKTQRTRYELRVVNGKWSHYDDGHWCALSDEWIDPNE